MHTNKNNGSINHEVAEYHRISPALRASLEWIEDVSGIKLDDSVGFRAHLASGEVLCNFINSLIPGAVKRINRITTRAAATDNLSLFTNACEAKCGISKSQLFRIDDFEDILDKRTESTQLVDKNWKCAERIAVSIFWLSRFANRDPRCKHLAKLDYSAFSGLLPKSLIQTSISSNGESSLSSRHSSSTIDSSQFGTVKSNGHAETKTTVLRHFERITLEDYSNIPNMRNSNHVPDQRNGSTSPTDLNGAVSTQINNNGLQGSGNAENDPDWQSTLDDWRNRRRRISRVQATKVQSMEEMKLEEERKQQQAVRDRMREIQTLRGSVTSFYIPSTDIIRSSAATSPGMALLTGIGTSLFDFPDNSSTDDTNMQHKSKHAIPATVVTKPDPSATESERADVQHRNEHYDPTEYREVTVCVQHKANASENRWGMTLKAEGASQTSPFIVDRVKIGSSADLCDVCKGDILVGFNGTALPTESIRLHELEQLMDKLFEANKTVQLVVLRSRSLAVKDSKIDLSDADSGSELLDDQIGGSESIESNRDEPILSEPSLVSDVKLPRLVLPSPQVETELSTSHHQVDNLNAPAKETLKSTQVNHDQFNSPLTTHPPCDNQTNTQVHESEIGRTCVDSQSEETSSCIPGTRRQATVTESEANYLRVAEKTEEAVNRIIIIRQPSVGLAETDKTPAISHSSDCDPESPLIKLSFEDSQLPPPPPLPLNEVATPPRYKLVYVPVNHSYGDPHRSQTDKTVALVPCLQRENTLPSPPPLHLMESNDYVNGASMDYKQQTNPHQQSFRNHRNESPSSNIVMQSEQRRQSSISEQTMRQSHATMREDALPTPPSPLFVEPKSHVNMEPRFEQRSMNTRYTDSNPSSSRRSYVPPLPMSIDQAPPQPPRVPGNKSIDPSNTCNTCMQELGTGDLMIIHAMNLYYHLTCFTCSQCGVALSDGSSNTEVRIKSSRLYCHECHLARHRHKTVAQGDARRRKSKLSLQQHTSSPIGSTTPIGSDRRRLSGGYFDQDLNLYTNL